MTMTTEISPLAVRRSIWINAPRERVWNEFESFERMRAWFGTGHTLLKYEPREGGQVEVDCADEGEPPMVFGGPITVFDPARELTFVDAWLPRNSDQHILITFQLTSHLDGTVVALYVHGFENLDGRAGERHRGMELGWTIQQIDALKARVEGV
jgi:uncharacterized protein YndB with AHSA1/START domain